MLNSADSIDNGIPGFRDFLALTEAAISSGDSEARESLIREISSAAIRSAIRQDRVRISRLAAHLARCRNTITPPGNDSEKGIQSVLTFYIGHLNYAVNHLDAVDYSGELHEKRRQRALETLTNPEYSGDY